MKASIKNKNKNSDRHYFCIGIVIDVVLCILASILIPFFVSRITDHQEVKKQINCVNHLSLGMNQDYIEQFCGKPFMKGNVSVKQTNYDDYYYKIKDGVLRTFYEDERLIAYFVTVNNDSDIKYGSNEVLVVTDNRFIGEFSFDGLAFSPEGNYGQYTNGSDLTFYIETYNSRPKTGYNYYIFGVAPYGLYFPDDEHTSYAFEDYHYIHGEYFGDSIPNTYGVVYSEDLIPVCAQFVDIDSVDYNNCNIYAQSYEEYLTKQTEKGGESDYATETAYNMERSLFEIDLVEYMERH